VAIQQKVSVCHPERKLRELRFEAGKQIPRGLKPARKGKTKRRFGTAEAVPFQIRFMW
jgi:hypothetical protein